MAFFRVPGWIGKGFHKSFRCLGGEGDNFHGIFCRAFLSTRCFSLVEVADLLQFEELDKGFRNGFGFRPWIVCPVCPLLLRMHKIPLFLEDILQVTPLRRQNSMMI